MISLNKMFSCRYAVRFWFLLFVFIVTIYSFLFPVTYFQSKIRSTCEQKGLSLIQRETVLVPVSINKLYDYRVVCNGNDERLDRTHLSERCRLNSNRTTRKIELEPPNDFQIKSMTTTIYRDQWKTKEKCSIFRNETLAIVIPYRDREENLRRLLFHLVPLLEEQGIFHYEIYLVEQIANGPFNKGRLYNLAFNYLMKTSIPPNCIIFHDVDLLPENSLNFYTCLSERSYPIHMSAQVRYDLNGSYSHIYPFLVGGVLAMRPDSFRRLNGFSNRYFNWGGEDDDMGLRLLAKDICVQRPTTGFYYAASHSAQKRNSHRFRLLFDAVLEQDSDGLTNIDQLAKVVQVKRYPLVNWMTVKWIESSVE